jgi:hypothetical protein
MMGIAKWRAFLLGGIWVLLFNVAQLPQHNAEDAPACDG